MEDCRAEIIRIITESDSLAFIASVYAFIKGVLSVQRGGESHE